MINCEICNETVVSSVEEMKLSDSMNRIQDHYMTHSWLRRKLHRLATLPRRYRLWRVQRMIDRNGDGRWMRGVGGV